MKRDEVQVEVVVKSILFNQRSNGVLFKNNNNIVDGIENLVAGKYYWGVYRFQFIQSLLLNAN